MGMTAGELIEYLKGFDAESEIAIIAANPKARKKYTGSAFVITDMGIPVLCLDISTESDLDEKEKAAAEKCEREETE